MAKTKALISFAVTAKLICVFVFAYAKSRFSHDAAQMRMTVIGMLEASSQGSGMSVKENYKMLTEWQLWYVSVPVYTIGSNLSV